MQVRRGMMVVGVLLLAMLVGIAVPALAAPVAQGAVEPTDAPPFGEVAVQGVPLLAVVLGLVELSKALGAENKVLILISLSIGLVLGIAYMLSLQFPQTYSEWFATVIYGLGLGLVASGLYNVGEGWARKAVTAQRDWKIIE